MNLAQAVDRTLKSLRSDVPDYAASGLVDMSSGMLLGVDTLDAHPREIIDIIAAATADLFRGRMVTQIQDMWRRNRAEADGRGAHLDQMLIYSDNLVHLFIRSTQSPDIVAVVVCRSSVNVGMLLAQARPAMRELDSFV